MEESRNLPDFGIYIIDKYKPKNESNLIQLKNVYFESLTHISENNILLNGVITLDSGEQYIICISLSQKAISDLILQCSKYIPFDDWICSENYGIPLHLQEIIVFEFRGLISINEMNSTSIKFYAEDLLIHEISETIMQNKHSTFEGNDSNQSKLIDINLPKYFLKTEWLDGWFKRGLNRKKKVTRDSMSDWIHEELLDNPEAENESKLNAYKQYLQIGFSEEESFSMSGLKFLKEMNQSNSNFIIDMISSIPEEVKKETDNILVKEVGFAAGPGFMAQHSKKFDSNINLIQALEYLEKYKGRFKVARVVFENDKVLSFDPSKFANFK